MSCVHSFRLSAHDDTWRCRNCGAVVTALGVSATAVEVNEVRLRAQGYAAGLEEAARIADDWWKTNSSTDEERRSWQEIAAAIRAKAKEGET